MRISIGLSDTARTRPLATGEVAIEGVEADLRFMGVQELFNHQLAHHEFDVCEFPLATYFRSLEKEDRPYLAVPVFPSRHFRLSCVFVSEKSDVRTPADLAGRRIGISVFDMAAGVWVRGMLHDHFGLDRHAPTYVIGGLEQPRRGDEHPQFYPPGFVFEHRTDASLAQLLAEGEIDALVTARAPSTWPDHGVRRLFDDPRATELDYYRRTGLFPAMHVLALKRPLAERCPELPMALYRAFTASYDAARARFHDSAALDSVLPWQLEHLLDTERLLGHDYWSSGVRANAAMLRTAVDYSLADGLISTAFEVADLFRGPGEADVLST
ncbi:MAG: 4,5-dihydroxyphthalate decarboxylase [Nocardioides sp.]|nr:4,5-dihydroxyphthalate decarboxylase [Nocardioides sp.]